jgi:hypothetical protein
MILMAEKQVTETSAIMILLLFLQAEKLAEQKKDVLDRCRRFTDVGY